MLRDLPVRDLMVGDVLTFAPDQNVQQAMRALVERSIGGAPVVDGGGLVVGVLSMADLIVEEARLHLPTIVNFLGVNVALPWHDRELDASVSKALGMYVREVMTADPATVGPDATVEDAATVMHDRQVSRVPVVDAGGRLVGLITRTDILRAVVRGLDEARAYDAGNESAERLGEVAGGDVDLAAREHREAAQARHRSSGATGATSGTGGTGGASGPGSPEDQDFGVDVGRI